MPVWILVAVMETREVLGGHVSVFTEVYATADACEHARADMARLNSKDFVWKCLREEPKK